MIATPTPGLKVASSSATSILTAAAGFAVMAFATASATTSAQASQFNLRDSLCRTPDGRAPMVRNDPASRHRAYAAMRGGQPVIVFNPGKMAQLSPITRIWVYYHECAHHALGHSSGNRLATRENDADCWAIRAMRYRGILTASRFRIIKADMHRVYHRGGSVHLPGHLRAQHLDLCLKTTGYGRIRDAKFTPRILRRQMAMRRGRGQARGNPRGGDLNQPYGGPNLRPHGHRPNEGRRGQGQPEPAPHGHGTQSFNERQQLEAN